MYECVGKTTGEKKETIREVGKRQMKFLDFKKAISIKKKKELCVCLNMHCVIFQQLKTQKVKKKKKELVVIEPCVGVIWHA